MTAVAQNYAETLLELAASEYSEEQYGRLIADVADLYRSERDFRLFLETPRVELSEKKQTIREVFGERVPERFLRFLLVMLEKRRQRQIPAVEEAYRELLDERLGRVQARVVLAVEPDEELRDRIREKLSAILDRDVVPHFRTDPEILGGLEVRVSDRVMDGSIRRGLQEMRRQLAFADSTEGAESVQGSERSGG